MKRIAICDDESSQAELLRGYVDDWARSRREPAEAGLFPSGEAFLFRWEEDKDWDALLLDIQMGGIDGMELARQLRRGGSALPIVFVTGMPDHISEGYEVEALHYLMKPVSQEKLSACLDRAMEKSAREPVLLAETAQGDELRLPLREIAAIEASGHRVRITTGDGEKIEVKTAFREITGGLPEGEFVQCHRSYVVGLRYVRLLQRERITLDSGEAIPVSRRNFSQVNDAFVRFYKNTGGSLLRE